MKKRGPIHPKLYLDILKDNNYLLYKKNLFDDTGNRIVEKELLDINEITDKKILYKKNLEQFEILKKYLLIQKKVLDKHKKDRNYDSCKVVKSSIEVMVSFKDEFEIWFKKNKR